MMDWRALLTHDPLPPLLTSGNAALNYWARRDLLNETVGPVETLWELREPVKLLRKQQADGSWTYPGGGKPVHRATEDYDQIETFRSLGYLVVKWGLNSQHRALRQAAEYLFSKQTAEGDLRGIYGNQYSPNYTAAILELLIKAGYGQDLRVARGLDWLLSVRQDDGGWAIALRTAVVKFDAATLGGPTLQPERSRSFSHMVTGVVLRAFAAHEQRRRTPEARAAGELLASRLFQKDAYPDRGSPEFWLRPTFPFWFTDLVSALDSLSWLGFDASQARVREALDWLIAQQQPDGAWRLRMLRGGGDKHAPLWCSLAIARVFKRMAG